MVTVSPSCLPISEIVVMGGGISNRLTAELAEKRRVERKYLFLKSQEAFLCALSELGGKYYAASNFSNVSLIFSIGFIFSFSSISRSNGGVCGADRSSSIACFQSIDPVPGHRCASRSLALSCT